MSDYRAIVAMEFYEQAETLRGAAVLSDGRTRKGRELWGRCWALFSAARYLDPHVQQRFEQKWRPATTPEPR